MSNILLQTKFPYPPQEHNAIASWNNNITMFAGFLIENKLFNKSYTLSNTYRVSDYCVEGERGYISKYNVLPDQYLKAVEELWNRREFK